MTKYTLLKDSLMYTYVAGLDGVVDGLGDLVCVLVQSQVTEHHDGAEEHGSGVSGVGATNISTDVTATL